MPQPFDSGSVSEWLKYLEGLHTKEIDLGLDRIRPVAQKIWPKNPCPVVTVAGTNGKGTTVAALQTLAAHAGWRIGVYTSPHLFQFNERIVLDLPDCGAWPVSDDVLVEAFRAVESARGDTTLTYFEFTALAALFIFQKIKLDLVILEVGMGGRLDATNVVDADVAIITRIALDHMEYLGDTREKIAVEKAGIMRLGKPCVYGGHDLHEIFNQCADKVGARLYSLGALQQDPTLKRVAQHTMIPVENLACAQKAFELLGGTCDADAWEHLAVKKPLGRFTRIEYQDKVIIFDVAHNPDSMALLAHHLSALSCEEIRVVVGMLSDKDHAASLLPLKQDKRLQFYVAPPNTPRAAPAQSLQAALKGSIFSAFNTLHEAFEASLEDEADDTVWVVTGSFYTVSEVWAHLQGTSA